jgi:hypothetical protein
MILYDSQWQAEDRYTISRAISEITKVFLVIIIIIIIGFNVLKTNFKRSVW